MTLLILNDIKALWTFMVTVIQGSGKGVDSQPSPDK